MFILVHGSSVDLTKVEGGFKHFDYRIDNETNKPENKVINNGFDANGPGMYNFDGRRYSESLINAAAYTGDEEGGFVHISKLDLEESELLNNRENDYISKEDWVDCVDYFVEKLRYKKGFSIDVYENKCEKIYNLMSEGGSVPFETFEEIFDVYEMSLSQEEYDPNNFDGDYDDWKEVMDEVFYMSEPCSHIFQEGGAESIVEHAINSSDNQWQVLVSIWNSIAIDNQGRYIQSFNDTFYDSVMMKLGEHYNLTATMAGEEGQDSYFIVFDPSSEYFNVEKVIDIGVKANYEKTF